MYLYLLERTTHRSLWARLSFQCEVKIGITATPEARLSSIRKTTKGQVEMIYLHRTNGARHYERRLHKMFVESRFRMSSTKAKKSNGETEWFFLNPVELLVLYAWLLWWRIRWGVWLAVAAWVGWVYFL